jgi:DNA-binding MarR family transcriptional regulator
MRSIFMRVSWKFNVTITLVINQAKMPQDSAGQLLRRMALGRWTLLIVHCYHPAAMDLQSFFPYRLAVLAEAVSQCTAQVYAQRFDLSRDEWRVIAALAELGPTRTIELAAHTTLEKMPISRAVARLERDGLVERTQAEDDRRNHVLRLKPAGQALVKKIVPMVLAREQFLLEALAPAERQALDAALGKLLVRARQLSKQG